MFNAKVLFGDGFIQRITQQECANAGVVRQDSVTGEDSGAHSVAVLLPEQDQRLRLHTVLGQYPGKEGGDIPGGD